MERCKQCNGYTGQPKELKVDDKVEFVIERRTGRTIKMSARTGKLMLIKSNGFSVIYRGTVYHVDSVSHPDDPSPISLAMSGLCSCETKSQVA